MRRHLFHNARIYTPIDRGRPLAGAEQGKLTTHLNGALLVKAGMIAAIGEKAKVLVPAACWS